MFSIVLAVLLQIGDNTHIYDMVEWEANNWDEAVIAMAECIDVVSQANGILFCELTEIK